MDDTTSARWITASLAHLDKTNAPPWTDATSERTAAMHTYYIEASAPSIGALNDKLRQAGVRSEAQHGGRLGYEVHYWITREDAQHVADVLTAGGYTAQVAERRS